MFALLHVAGGGTFSHRRLGLLGTLTGGALLLLILGTVLWVILLDFYVDADLGAQGMTAFVTEHSRMWSAGSLDIVLGMASLFMGLGSVLRSLTLLLMGAFGIMWMCDMLSTRCRERRQRFKRI